MRALLILLCCLTFQQAPSRLERLLDLMQARLNLAPQVARAKWNDHLPLQDLAREEQILAQLPVVAGLDPLLERDFFQAQMEASKTIQEELHQHWQETGQPPFKSYRTLSQLRPELDQLTLPLLEALAQAQPLNELNNTLEIRFPDGLTPAWEQAIEPLRPQQGRARLSQKLCHQ